jgi:hypothetical protein
MLVVRLFFQQMLDLISTPPKKTVQLPSGALYASLDTTIASARVSINIWVVVVVCGSGPNPLI